MGFIACSDDSPDEPVDPPDALGPFGVGHETLDVVDADREDRPLHVDVWYPVDPDVFDELQESPRTQYPLNAIIDLPSTVAIDEAPVSARQSQTLIVFSHGYGGINTQSIELMEALASHGFIVASPEHTGNAQSSNTDSFDEAAAHRVPDVSFVIDVMIERNRNPDDVFHERIDEDSVGVVGHSFGGMTSIGMAAGWAGAEPDERVAAIVPISAVIDGDLQSDTRTGPNAGFTAEQLATVDIPVMLMGGTEDEGVPVENNGIAFEQMVNAPVVYRVDIIGATHTHFANICAIGDLLIEGGITMDLWPTFGAEDLIEPYETTCADDVFPVAEVSRLQNLYVVSFFRRYLLRHEGYGRYLSEEHAAQEEAVTCWVRD
jgi:predicted dienelactone hydrolase